MTKIERSVLRWLQRRCMHPGSEVVADVLQADNRPTMVTWCSTCGAYAINDAVRTATGDWRELRRPEPTWGLR
jgi:hypothetical protein